MTKKNSNDNDNGNGLPVTFNRESVKLGYNPSAHDARTLQFAKYLPRVLPTPPKAFDWLKADPTPGMMLNDKLGCCVPVGMMHMERTFAANNGRSVLTPTDAEIKTTYSAIGGYVDGDPTTDNGCDPLTALKYWKNTGITMGGVTKKILAYMRVNPHNTAQFKAATWLFGGVFSCWALPQSAEGKNVWSVDHAPGDPNSPAYPGSWGGHCAPIGKEMAGPVIHFGQYPAYAASTWGTEMPVTDQFVLAYCDEAWVVLTEDWLNAQGEAPSGFNLAQLKHDFLAVTGSELGD